jgi:hypothetical protein
MVRVFTIVSVFVLVATVAAQQVPKDKKATEIRTHAVGAYEGVIPGKERTPAVRVSAGTTPPTVTWPGFQMRADGSSRFFVQLTAPTETRIESAGTKLVIVLANTRVAGRNNQRALETKHFNTPVTRAYLKRGRKESRLVFELRVEVMPVITELTEATGYHFMFFDFPKGTYIEQPVAPPSNIPPAPPTQTQSQSGVQPSGKASVSASASGSMTLSSEQMKALDNETPPAVKAGAQGKAKAKAGFSFGK